MAFFTPSHFHPFFLLTELTCGCYHSSFCWTRSKACIILKQQKKTEKRQPEKIPIFCPTKNMDGSITAGTQRPG
jgi:hypothetical protein